eukprot:Phypoly_transcript_00345.p1 GENE.Phypoly_transcript_00345~~Phypoly_transcript_00345.p1  ORF type:complete len:1272 (-),score=156.56 Phypoly_transcript_00345:88-3903(-)
MSTDTDLTFSRITFNFQDQPQREASIACKLISEAISLRKKYVFTKAREDWNTEEPIAVHPNMQYGLSLEDGVYKVFAKTGAATNNQFLESPPSFHTFWEDYSRVLEITNEGPVKTYAYWRLKILERKFELHTKLNRNAEKEANKYDVKDWATVTKVDTHVHLAAAMTRKHLLSFISAKAEHFGEEIVMQQATGKHETLADVLARLNLSKERLTIEALDVEAGSSTFQRFDEFNSKYNPFGFSELRTIFLKSSNFIQGRYMAELTKELFKYTEEAVYHATEYRVSIYGSKRNEWTMLAKWVNDYNVRSPKNRWLVQIPRIFKTFFASGNIKTFQEMLDNIFLPLFEVTLNPSTDMNLHSLLLDISGFDSVDDESKLERMDKSSLIFPYNWNIQDNPPYAYYSYYMYANIFTLNRLREAKGLNVFDFRPHCGESGDVDNLAAGFLLAKGVNHGINLLKTPPLQYLYYLCDIGLAVSPLSNNSLFLDYKRNPFYSFFQRGLNVSLSTDDPLQFHHTQSPLVEEYVVASKRWKLNECDLSEIARYSVLQSGFTHATKAEWLGKNYYLHGIAGNDISFTNVPNIRIAYRTETRQEEMDMLNAGGPILSPEPTLLSSATHVSTQSAINVSTDALGTLPEIPKQTNYNRVIIVDPAKGAGDPETDVALRLIREALSIRNRYKSLFSFESQAPASGKVKNKNFAVKCVDGIINLYHTSTELCSYDMTSAATISCIECNSLYCTECDLVLHKHPTKKFHHRTSLSAPVFQTIPIHEFYNDLRKLVVLISNSGPLRTYCATRLDIMENLFVFHTLLNDHLEHKARMDIALHEKGKIRKVDNHVHLAGSTTAIQLLTFIQKKLKNNPNDIVKKSGNETLSHMFERLGIDERYLTLDSLGVKADDSVYHRFDSLNSKYRPFGSSELHNLFLRRTNDMEGRYFAELVKELFTSNEKLDAHTEIGISLYGRQFTDWDYLGWWIHHYKIDTPNNRWIVQIPRLFNLHKKNGDVKTFQEMLINIFVPLLEASKNPERHPFVAEFLQKVTAFDIVDDEGQIEMNVMITEPPVPQQWDSSENPPYAYYAYYIYANLIIINECRKSLGLNTFEFRPHCGATGEMNHLAIGFMFASNIVHGLNLRRSSILQYLYYIAQIGITCSVVSEDSLYIPYESNPFPSLFRRGLNVTLSTDNPLLLHSTSEPLSEEYAIAAQMWKLSECDLCEIAMNSMRQTGFYSTPSLSLLSTSQSKRKFGIFNGDHTGVPDVRLRLREQILREEWVPIHDFHLT